MRAEPYPLYQTVSGNVAARSARTRNVNRRLVDEVKGTVMDPYTADKLLDYNRQELARLRGNRKWTTLFRR